MKIELVASVTNNGFIGNEGDLLYESKADMKWFRDITINHPCLMGRKTYNQILLKRGQPLTNRHSIVLSNVRPNVYEKNFDNVTWVSSLEQAFSMYHDLNLTDKKGNPYPLMVIGGTSVYQQTISRASKLHVTKICLDIDGDKKFPEIDDSWYCHYQRPTVEPDAALIVFQRFSKRG